MVLPYTPAAPDRLTAALPMPRTNCPVPLVSSVTAAVSFPADGTTLLGIVSVMLTDFVPSNVLPLYVSQQIVPIPEAASGIRLASDTGGVQLLLLATFSAIVPVALPNA